jgi:ammonia channel protein AmtB
MKIANRAWSVLTKIKLILCVDLLLWMRLGFTITHQNPNSSQNSWTESSCSASKKTRSVPSAEKVMTLVFWDAEGIFFIIVKRVKQ